ncbi:MAG TPA: DNA-3-methyladenine glycosylase [Pyrinomonadaceae bacterium]|nr:DNA-3-methyladenine glycosylase [Pyrinomonadaceae bacterium]
MPLDRKFYAREDTAKIARELLGKLLVVASPEGRVSGMIVETEAYLGEIDRAAHSFGGRRTKRNEVMYGEPGFAYVFFVYGMYNQFNCVTGVAGTPHAILIRGVEPVDGVELMQKRRLKAKRLTDLTSGPGKLCIAMGIDRSLNGEDLLGSTVFIEEYRTVPSKEIASGKRIGIDYAGEDADLPLRFWIAGNAFVSRK